MGKSVRTSFEYNFIRWTVLPSPLFLLPDILWKIVDPFSADGGGRRHLEEIAERDPTRQCARKTRTKRTKE